MKGWYNAYLVHVYLDLDSISNHQKTIPLSNIVCDYSNNGNRFPLVIQRHNTPPGYRARADPLVGPHVLDGADSTLVNRFCLRGLVAILVPTAVAAYFVTIWLLYINPDGEQRGPLKWAGTADF